MALQTSKYQYISDPFCLIITANDPRKGTGECSGDGISVLTALLEGDRFDAQLVFWDEGFQPAEQLGAHARREIGEFD
jgi:hypothetical protein